MDNSKPFWKIMKNIFPDNKEKITTPQSIKTDDGKTVIDLPTVAQRFNEFFTGSLLAAGFFSKGHLDARA